MSYKLPTHPADTPITNAAEFASDPDQHGQIQGLVCSDVARELERKLTAPITAERLRVFAAEVEARCAKVLADKGPGWVDDEYHLRQVAGHLTEAAEDLGVVEFAQDQP